MQKFSLHSHTNSYGIFDGSNSIEEMIKAAEEKGFTEYGISNHMICYPDYMLYPVPIYFKSFDVALDIYKKLVNDIREAAARYPMKVRVGFEVNFFRNAAWRKKFEKAIKQLDVDYLIGANHDLFDNDFKKVCSIYDIRDKKINLPPEVLAEWTHNHWRSSIEMVKSGYFDFIAHFDVIKEMLIPEDSIAEDLKWKMAETLIEHKQPFELNTSYNRVDEQSPSEELLRELGKNNIPVLISDDSHDTNAICQHFEKAEVLLAKLNYENRWRPPSKAKIK